MNRDDLQALACEDCPAVVHVSRGQGLSGPVRVVVVEHEASCPWLTRVAPDGATVPGALGVLTHRARRDDEGGLS
ncbi:hypothetical protein E1287_14200 [Actinomadura sp. KC06]|uniref:hypothetical protein n=1 Tax=Actinomadura sp. KC06 TaxID=2530369 RepID=UPI0010446BAF|nr:hypothetical protein [Actinomadura sp. KC06]TDD35259.1 hypothetical protein E1287_14200 [Actinomadura sp. KC06]